MNRSKIIQMVIVLAAIVVIASSISRFVSRDSLSLSEYMQQNPGQSPSGPTLSQENSPVQSTAPPEEGSPVQSAVPHSPEESALTGAALNGLSQAQERTTLEEGFYYEPISHRLRRYMTGLSLSGEEDPEEIEDLCYVHILHYDFGGNPVEGELICSRLIAQDLLEIFHELYLNEYKIEKVLLAEEYSGDMAAAIEDNNTFCFGGRTQEDSHSTRHSQGLAVDINPLYNPYVSYGEDDAREVFPSSGAPSAEAPLENPGLDYGDRRQDFPYKIDENDLCYKLFLEHGFTWGGNWNDAKGYMHFQKPAPSQGSSD